jgi:hypothetical protein
MRHSNQSAGLTLAPLTNRANQIEHIAALLQTEKGCTGEAQNTNKLQYFNSHFQNLLYIWQVIRDRDSACWRSKLAGPRGEALWSESGHKEKIII